MDRASAKRRHRSAIELHRLDAIADFEGRLGGVIELNVFRHLPDDRMELARRHMSAVAFFDIPELDEDLAPGFRICPAVQRRELPSLDFGDMIAGLHRTASVIENQR